MKFRMVKMSEINIAYGILASRIDELIKMATGQYTFHYPIKDEYIERNRKNENWCLIANSKMVGIVSLIKNFIPIEWTNEYYAKSNYWLSSLFVDPNEKGKKYGEYILNECTNIAVQNEIKEILLDCYMDSGFLVPYYERNGFTKITQKVFEYPNRSFTAGLMIRKI